MSTTARDKTPTPVPVRVTDASVRQCVMYANLDLRGQATDQIGTTLTVAISSAYDAWLAQHDAEVRASVLSALTDMWLLKRRSHGKLADAAARAVLALIEQETTK